MNELEELRNTLEEDFDVVSYFDGERLLVDTDVGNFNIRYTSKWGYLVEFSNEEREFSELKDYPIDAAKLIETTLQEEAVMSSDYGNEDHSMDFDDEESSYFLGGGKGW